MTLEHTIDELEDFVSLNVEMSYALDASRKVIRDAVDGKNFYCFICSQTDNKKIPVIYNYKTNSFQHQTAEAHSQEIIWYYNTKEFLYQLAIKDEGVFDVKEGAKLTSPETRAALYVKTRHKYGKTVAFEISSPVARKPVPVKIRHRGYQSKNIHDQWIYSAYTSNPFFSYDYKHGLVVDAAMNRIGFIVVRADSSAKPTINNVMFAQLSDKNLAHLVKYVCWTDARDWSISDEGLEPRTGSGASSFATSLTENRKRVEQESEAEKSKRDEILKTHKEEAIARAKKRGIDPDKGHEVFIPPLEDPPYSSFPLSYGMMVEQGAYMAHLSPFDYIKTVLDASYQWNAYAALRSRWESTGKYDKSTFPAFELLKKKAN
jgi:hypothetical protein